jgi:hypothetical protein
MSTLNQGVAVWQLYITVPWCIMDHTSSSRNRPVKNMLCFRKNTKAIAFEEYIVGKHTHGR